MRFTLDQLAAFVAVARAQGVRRAAETMHLSQPAITARIQALEAALATRLFERQGTGMHLTRQGEVLLRYADEQMRLLDRIRRDVCAPADVAGRLRLGVAETVALTWLPAFIARMRAEFPRIDVEIAVDMSVNLSRALVAQQLDLAILVGMVTAPAFANLSLPEVELGWYAGPATLPDGDPRSLFLSLPIVTFARSTQPFHELKADLFDRYGSGVTFITSSSLSACLGMVGAGLGIAALPRPLAQRDIDARRVVAFDPGWTPSNWTFTAALPRDPPNFVAERAATVAQETARQSDQEFRSAAIRK
ncbi:MAG: LysR family transcriptional regulator [Sneathiellaceae bacterium]